METLLKILSPLLVKLAPLLIAMSKFSPYFHLKNKDGTPYMNRYWLVKPRWFTFGWSVRIHEILSSDDDRALHDHPWSFWSLILRGGYSEVLEVHETSDGAQRSWLGNLEENIYDGVRTSLEPQTGKWILSRWLDVGKVNVNGPDCWHRLRLLPAWLRREEPAVTLFVSAPKTVSWGFLVNGEKVPWREYLAREFGAEHVMATEANLNKAFGRKS